MTSSADSREWMTTAEAARVLGVQPFTLRSWRYRGTEPVPSVKIGSAVLFDAAAVRRYATTRRGTLRITEVQTSAGRS